MRLRSNEVGSEMLPTDWNRNDKTYAMKYVLNDNVYVLMGTVSEDSFIMNFLVRIISIYTFKIQRQINGTFLVGQ